MPKQIIIAEQHRIAAVFWEDQIQELVVATGNHQVGDIYLGVVENVLPGIDAAFVNIGDAERNGFIHVTDLGPLRLKRSAGAITELLAPQQKVLVQVMKEPTGNKGPRLTGNITLPGRYLVLMPSGKGVNLSRRIKNENERNRLRALAILIKPAGMGLLVRTEAEGKAEEAIMEDLETLQKQWEYIQQESNSSRAPALLNRDDDFIQRVLRDMYSADVNRVVADSSQGLKRIKQYLVNWNGGRSPEGVLIDHHRERQSILEYFRVNAAIKDSLKPRVDLPSGGYIIIEPTEALTVIDVNSGSFTRSATARETVLWTNCEAASEIARQLRLRNIAGVIIVEFIDMDSWKDKLQVLEHFTKALKIDKARPQIAQLSELGLVELTRKRQGKNVYEIFGSPCPSCGGLGHIVQLPGEVAPVVVEQIIEPVISAPVKSAYPIEMPETLANNVGYREKPVINEVWESENLEDEDDENVDFNSGYQDRLRSKGNTRRRVRAREDNNNRGLRPATGMPIINSSYPPVARGGEPYIPQNPRFPGVEYGEDRRSSNNNNRPERFNRPIKPDVERPEVISVEMTPEEQEMYALMGISPLVRLERDVTNPKSVIVSVNSPGELTETINIITPRANFAEDYNDSDEDFSQSHIDSNDLELDDTLQSDFADTVLVSDEHDFNAQSIDSDDNYASEIFSLTEDSYTDSDLDSDLDSEDLEDNSENAKSRRRRRRSSATFELD